MISQLFILSERGDKIIFKDFRHDMVNCVEIFFKHVNKDKKRTPCFSLSGIHFFHTKRNGLYFVLSTRENISPSYAVEILDLIFVIINDFLGETTEQKLRKNIPLIYELLNEMIDFGYLQQHDVLGLKISVRSGVKTTSKNDSPIHKSILGKLVLNKLVNQNTLESSEARKSILNKNLDSNQIFIDMLEYINFIFNGKGEILKSEVVGKLVIKSYLGGSPKLSIGFTDNLPKNGVSYNEIVKIENPGCISFFPPIGEINVMTYRLNRFFQYPFRMFPDVRKISDYKAEVILRIKSMFDKTQAASKVLVKLPIPDFATSVSVEFGIGSSQSYEYKNEKNYVLWGIKRFIGGTEQLIKMRIALEETKMSKDQLKSKFSPITMRFELPMFNCANLRIKYLDFGTTQPDKWVRYITKPKNYSIRL